MEEVVVMGKQNMKMIAEEEESQKKLVKHVYETMYTKGDVASAIFRVALVNSLSCPVRFVVKFDVDGEMRQSEHTVIPHTAARCTIKKLDRSVVQVRGVFAIFSYSECRVIIPPELYKVNCAGLMVRAFAPHPHVRRRDGALTRQEAEQEFESRFRVDVHHVDAASFGVRSSAVVASEHHRGHPQCDDSRFPLRELFLP